MSKNQSGNRISSKKPTNEPETRHNDRVGLVQLFYRYGWDALAVFAVILGLLTLFGKIGWTQGTLISIWLNFLDQLFGWGTYGIIFSLFFIAYWIFRRRVKGEEKVRLGKIIVIEIAFFFLLALFSVIGNADLVRAESGKDGGIIGWGLASLFLRFIPDPLLRILLIVLTIIFAAIGFGFFAFLIKFLDKLLDKIGQESDMPSASSIDHTMTDTTSPTSGKRVKETNSDSESGKIRIIFIS